MNDLSSSPVKSGIGYASEAYAASFGHTLRALPNCGGQMGLRPIADTGLRDASGCYPVFSCPRPAQLVSDLCELPRDLVAVSLVPDPLVDFDLDALQTFFPIVRPLGDHYLVRFDSDKPRPNSHHRRMLRRAAAHPIEVRIESNPHALLDDWVGLYDNLVAEAGIRGLRRFSRPLFSAMLAVPGTVVFTAWERDQLLGADWYYQDGERVYAHLSAYASQGYGKSVSYPMMDAALQHFSRSARVLDLGGAPTLGTASDGLRYFKAGWSTGMVPSYFCGRALDMAAYLTVSGGQAPSAQSFFPHYRQSDYA